MRADLWALVLEMSSKATSRLSYGIGEKLVCYWKTNGEPDRICVYAEGDKAEAFYDALLSVGGLIDDKR